MDSLYGAHIDTGGTWGNAIASAETQVGKEGAAHEAAHCVLCGLGPAYRDSNEVDDVIKVLHRTRRRRVTHELKASAVGALVMEGLGEDPPRGYATWGHYVYSRWLETAADMAPGAAAALRESNAGYGRIVAYMARPSMRRAAYAVLATVPHG
jgi:hypothetical protein